MIHLHCCTPPERITWLPYRKKTLKSKQKALAARIGPKEKEYTMKPLASGHAALGKRLMAIHLFCSNLPLYTKLGAFSPLSETIWSLLNELVALLNNSKGNSLNAGTSSGSARRPFSKATLQRTCQRLSCESPSILSSTKVTLSKTDRIGSCTETVLESTYFTASIEVSNV